MRSSGIRVQNAAWLFAGLLACLAGWPLIAVAAPEKRVALVLGNGHYDSVARLDNPGRDAALIAEALRHTGFSDVTLLTDLTREKLVEALRGFAAQAGEADWAVLYYAGHGIEMNGMNYLVPVDARLATDRDLQFEGVPLPQALASVEGARKLRLLILDACRDNPFSTTMKRMNATRSLGRGLAEIEPEGGTLVAYAAKHGQFALDGSGAHGPFVTALVRHLRTPGLEINRLFRRIRSDVLAATGNRQEPFVYGSLPDEDFYFTPPLGALPAVPDTGGSEEGAKGEGAKGEGVKSEGADGGTQEAVAPIEKKDGVPLAVVPEKPDTTKPDRTSPAAPAFRQRARPTPVRRKSIASITPPARVIEPALPKNRPPARVGPAARKPLLEKPDPPPARAKRVAQSTERPAPFRPRPAQKPTGGAPHCFVFNGERVCE